MKLVVIQRCEQGTASGVMKFNPGPYDVKKDGELYTVSHEVREVERKVEGVKKILRFTSTVVPKSILDKMVANGVAKLEG